jgi:hypothetical protein
LISGIEQHRDLIAGTFPDISDHWDTPGSSQQSEEGRFGLVSGFRIRIGSGFDQVSGSGSVFGIQIQIQEAKMTHKSRQKCRNMF